MGLVSIAKFRIFVSLQFSAKLLSLLIVDFFSLISYLSSMTWVLLRTLVLIYLGSTHSTHVLHVYGSLLNLLVSLITTFKPTSGFHCYPVN